MTKYEGLITALECITRDDVTCETCEYDREADCSVKIQTDGAKAIRRLVRENEALRAELKGRGDGMSVYVPQEDEPEPFSSLLGFLIQVRARLTQAEILAQLAEECCELGQAALKLRRVLDGGNPTPVRTTDALDALDEEMRDVIGCLLAVGGIVSMDNTVEELVSTKKFERWADRLRKRRT